MSRAEKKDGKLGGDQIMKITTQRLREIIKEELEESFGRMSRREREANASRLPPPENWYSKMKDAERERSSSPDHAQDQERLRTIVAKINKLKQKNPQYYDTKQGGMAGFSAVELKKELAKVYPDPDEVLYWAREIDPYGWS